MAAYAVTLENVQEQVVLGDDGRATVGDRECRVVQLGRDEFAVQIGERIIRVVAVRVDGAVRLSVNGLAGEAVVLSRREAALRAYAVRGGASAGPAEVRAPMPALVVRVEVAPGDAVKAGQGLVVLEAMKMENELRATHDGLVREVHVVRGATVEKNQLLLRLEEGS